MSDGSGVGRRGFLTMTGVAAASLGGVFGGSASAAEFDATAPGNLGFGAQSYGAYGYGGVEATN